MRENWYDVFMIADDGIDPESATTLKPIASFRCFDDAVYFAEYMFKIIKSWPGYVNVSIWRNGAPLREWKATNPEYDEDLYPD